ncbi:hypothetical protein J43TS9_43760 [Paenibacillus cineris]|nr:hypothetical protein J43TS9_43760 [Paenibacillus cineris]
MQHTSLLTWDRLPNAHLLGEYAIMQMHNTDSGVPTMVRKALTLGQFSHPSA